MKRYFIFLLFVFVWGCGVQRETENYDLRSDTDLTLTAQNHPHGFQKRECFYCHVKANIHQVARYSSSFDLEYVRSLVEENGISVCRSCHGANGN